MSDEGVRYAGLDVLVTGGLGFIGSNLAHALVTEGARVCLLDNRMAGGGANPANLQGIEDRVTLIEGDVRDPLIYGRVPFAPAVVFHLAARLQHGESVRNPLEDLSVNAHGTLQLLEAARERWPGARIVYAGTRGQYGRPEREPVDEDAAQRPADPNGVAKRAGEEYVLLYHRMHRLAGVSLRLTNVYGPRHLMHHARQGFVAWFVRRALEGEEIELWGGGKMKRDLLYVDDAAEALLGAGVNENAPGQAFNVASGGAHTVREVAELAIKLAGSGRVVEKPYPEVEGRVEVGDFVASIERARKVLAWSPKTPLETGLARTIEFCRAHRSDYFTDPLA